MNAFRTRRQASRAPAVALLLVSVGIAGLSGFFNLFAVDVVTGSRIAELSAGSWIGRLAAWQWDAITVLGSAGAFCCGN